MTDKKKQPPARLTIPFLEALERFTKTKPDELAEELGGDLLKSRERIKKRIQNAHKEIEDGAISQKGRFRL